MTDAGAQGASAEAIDGAAGFVAKRPAVWRGE